MTEKHRELDASPVDAALGPRTLPALIYRLLTEGTAHSPLTTIENSVPRSKLPLLR